MAEMTNTEIEELKELIRGNAANIEHINRLVQQLSMQERKLYAKAFEDLLKSIVDQMEQQNELTKETGVKVYQNVKGLMGQELQNLAYTEHYNLVNELNQQTGYISSNVQNPLMGLMEQQKKQQEDTEGALKDVQSSLRALRNAERRGGTSPVTLTIMIIVIADLLINIFRAIGLL
ncbi:MAG: hypothetical protein IJR58_01830 [Lachnospiraceae bacterium]|nr:hypothetical protein [Lachnospiraceae bacterium]